MTTEMAQQQQQTKTEKHDMSPSETPPSDSPPATTHLQKACIDPSTQQQSNMVFHQVGPVQTHTQNRVGKS